MKKIDRRALISNGLWLVAFLIVFFGIRAYQKQDIAQGPAPVLEGRALDGHNLSLTTIDKPVVVHFWASWCRICRWEQDTMKSIAKTYPVVTVAMQSGSDREVQDHVTKNNLHFPVINDRTGELSRRFGVSVVPTTFIVNRSGDISFVEVGYTSEIGLRTRLWLASFWN
jgi:thiol-disulfide isomerase/thioredoxin